MTERIDQELELLRSAYPNLEYLPEGRWVRLRHFRVPEEGKWVAAEVAVAFQFPVGYPGQKPYGFHVSPPPVQASGAAVQNAAPSGDPPWDGPWLKFSWDVPEWAPTDDVRVGSNMLNYVLTFEARLRQGA